METVGRAAQRLLAKLEARAAKEKIAGGFSVMVEDSAHGVNRHGGRPDRPPHRDDLSSEDRAEALPVRNGIADSASRSAGGGEAGSSSRFAVPLRPACNDNRRGHTETRACSAISARSIDFWQV